MSEKLKFHESLETLKASVKNTGIDGEWLEAGDSHEYRARNRAVLRWWPSTGTLSFQGPSPAAEALRSSLSNQWAVGAETVDEPGTQVFIVHGHDRDAVDQLKIILFELKLQPYILQEKSSGGKTLIEALESHLDHKSPKSSFGIVLLTPDDLGASIEDGVNGVRPRARQNVILEMGMLISSVGRDKTLILVKGDKLELPSDAMGIIYARFHNNVKEKAAEICDRISESGIKLRSEDITQACR